MKRTIIFGAVASAFLVLSMAWLVPVQVKAYEMQSEKEIYNKITEMGQRLENDANFDLLIQLHSSQEIENIFHQVLQTDNSEDMQALAQEYINIIGREQLNQIFTEINEDYGEDLEAVSTSLEKLYGDKKDATGNFRVEQADGKLKVTKLESIELKENSLVFTEEGNIIFPDGSIFTGIDWEKLADFCLELAFAGIVVAYAGMFVAYFGMILEMIGFVKLGSTIFIYGYTVAKIAIIFGLVFEVLSFFFVWLSSQEDKEKTLRIKIFDSMEILRLRLRYILDNFFHKISI